jgi:hypothetical protein
MPDVGSLLSPRKVLSSGQVPVPPERGAPKGDGRGVVEGVFLVAIPVHPLGAGRENGCRFGGLAAQI